MTALRPERETDASYGDQSYGASGALGDWYPQEAGAPAPEASARAARAGALPAEAAAPAPVGGEGQAAARPYRPPADDETVALRLPDPPDDETVALRIPDPPPRAGTAKTAGAASDASSAASATGVTPGGRAARRKAAKRRGGRHGGRSRTPESPGAVGADEDGDEPKAPLSRVEARRQARARKPGAAVVVSRAIGEVFITTGVLMLLFVTYQLWWTNIRAHAQADKETSSLQDDWANGKRAPGVFAPGQGFAILDIPKLDVVVPIAEGVSNKKVLDKGMVGHYSEGALKTAMPDAKTGNFGLAAHRNTRGEPFRYINRLKPGDPVVVETQDKYYVYKVTSMLPVTPPSNTSVLDPVPKQSGFTGPGRYITLTTCTPEFTSKYRLIVWGKMVEERPRSKGKPDALVE